MIKLKDIIKESKRLNLFEQSLPEVSFQDNFENNFTTVTGNWKQKADLVVSQIQDSIKQGNQLDSLVVDVRGGASKISATNRYKGAKAPDHDFGGDPDFPGWVTFNLDGKERPLGQYPDGYKLIPNGNKYLAKARAENLKNLLVKHISEKLGEKFDSINVVPDPVDSKSTKYARAVVRANVTPPTEQPRYVIQYPWYKVGNQPNMVLVDGNIAAGWRQNKPGTMSTKWYRSTITDKNILYSGFQKDGQAGGGMHAYAFVKLNAIAYRGSMAIYKDEKSWLADVKKMTQYAPGLQVGELRSGDPNSKEILPGYRGANGYLDKTGSSKYTGLAKFQMRSKDYIVSNGADYYLFKPQGDQANYITDLFPAKNEFSAPADGAVDSKGNRSRIRGSQYSAENPNAITYSGVTTIETFS